MVKCLLQAVFSMEYHKDQSWDLCYFYFMLMIFLYASNFETTLFADDTNLHISHYDIHVLQSQIKQEVNNISN